ncbi:hypothetical protein FA13DRAFT_1743121 [Coprinellus micaceus]|uniref:Uncharacterized protein n=1 Tax=Coprinellus micaceus TaxID=71717 RepID=A0A4Y7SF11_COPMI|nr:hypothetical protein FA13DRAFT_1743121 [Coprinellus micaceus]
MPHLLPPITTHYRFTPTMSSNNEIDYQSLYPDEEHSDAGSESASDLSDPGTPATFPRATEDQRLSGDVNPTRNATASKKSKLTPHETDLPRGLELGK